MSGAPGPKRIAVGRRRWRANWTVVFAAAIAWIGMLVLLYPSVANWFSQIEQSRIIQSYTAEVNSGVDPPATEQIAAAHAYNRALNSGALVAANQRLPIGEGTSTKPELDYSQQLRVDAAGVMARLRVPSIGVDLPVYHGTSDDTLLRGVGHLEGTSLPVGGADTHSVLTAHRGLASAAMFTDLNLVEVGDTFSVAVFDQVLTYEVVSTVVVDPDQTESLRPVQGKDLVTLITCTPLGINSQRILVTGERVEPTPTSDVIAAAARPDVPGFPWWAVVLGVGTVLVGLYVWRSGYPVRRRRRSHVLAEPIPAPAAVVAPAVARCPG